MKQKKTLKRDLIINELRLVAQDNGGKLKPGDAVEFARNNPNSALHSCVTWKDGEAAEKWRLHQMRNIINVTYQFILVGEKEHHYKAFWSFRKDRKLPGGGYTPVVMTQKQMREQMLEEAMLDLEVFEAKYSALKELVDEISSIRRRYAGKKKVVPIREERIANGEPVRNLKRKAG